VWKGGFEEGVGTISTESGALSKTQYSSHARFSKRAGFSPDELIAASLSGCFSLVLANQLEVSGYDPKRIETTTTATLEQLAVGWTMTRMQLDVHANVPNATESDFLEAALTAKMKCPVARLCNATISMSASLDNEHQSASHD
jgi:osmotically inducible protein OsmC